MAINFPSTVGQPTNGSFTHTSSGVTWQWDGTTWKAQGITGSYTLPIASGSSLGGIKVGNNLSIAGDGTLSATAATVNSFTNIAVAGQNTVTADSSTDTLTLIAGTGITLTTNSASDSITITSTGGGGSGGLSTRTTAAATTAAIANNASGDITITAAKTYALMKVQTSAAAWVTIYTDATSRTNDASRTQNTDPAPGSGVLAEVVTTGAQTILMTPAVYGFNDDSTPSNNVYLKVVNKSGSTVAITVTLTYLQLEA